MQAPTEARYWGSYVGKVMDTADPENLRRVKVNVEGLLEPKSGWARPVGLATRHTPRQGQLVKVEFNRGNIDDPLFDIGPYSKQPGQEVPTEYESPLVSVFETETFRVVVDERAGQRKATIKSIKNLGTGIDVEEDKIEIDADANSITISAATKITLKAIGEINLDANAVTIMERGVVPNPDVPLG